MFSKFDKIVKSDNFLHDPKFNIAITNPTKTFDKFLARLPSAIVPLDLKINIRYYVFVWY